MRRFQKMLTTGQQRPMKKEWILTAASIAGSLASSLIGGNASAKAAQRAREEERGRHIENQAFYRRKMFEDYLDTAAGQRMVTLAQNYADKNWKKAEGSAAVAGGTDVAVAQAKEAGNKMMGDTISGIAANDTARKDRAGEMAMADNNQHSQTMQNTYNQEAANISQAAGAASSAIFQGLAGLDKDWKNTGSIA